MFNKMSRLLRPILFYTFFALIFLSSAQLGAQGHRILYVTPEMYPFTAEGGLSNVMESIPEAVIAEGEEADLVMPLWSFINKGTTSGIKDTDKYIEVKTVWGGTLKARLSINKTRGGVNVIFINDPVDSEGNSMGLFTVPEGKSIYDETDEQKADDRNIKKFAFFDDAVLEVIEQKGTDYYDIIHTNDWTTALVPWRIKFDTRYQNIESKNIYMMHNIGTGAQGLFGEDKVRLWGIDPKYLNPFIKGSVSNFGSLNLTKAGGGAADVLTTVSPEYAEDIKVVRSDGKNMNLLEGFLNSKEIIGIGHGTDAKRFDPSISNIKYPFNEKDFTKNKLMNKYFVQHKDNIDLPVKDVPLFIVTTRGDEQKNSSLAYEAIKMLLAKGEDIQVIIMGNGYEKVFLDGLDLKTRFESLSQKYEDKLVAIPFDKSFQAQLEAAADFQLIISDFEPGGVEPNIAKLNKVVSIVHPVNGLKNSVVGANDPQGRPQTGIIVKDLDFKNHKVESIYAVAMAMKDAINLYENVNKLRKIRSNMAGNYSWRPAAKKYVELYNKVAGDGKTPGDEGQTPVVVTPITDPVIPGSDGDGVKSEISDAEGTVVSVADKDYYERLSSITDFLTKKYGKPTTTYDFVTSTGATGVANVNTKGVYIVLKSQTGIIDFTAKDLPKEVFPLFKEEYRKGKMPTEMFNIGNKIHDNGKFLEDVGFKNTFKGKMAVVAMLTGDEQTEVEKILYATMPAEEKARLFDGDLSEIYAEAVYKQDMRTVLLMYTGEESGTDTYLVNTALEHLSDDFEANNNGKLSPKTLIILAREDVLSFMLTVANYESNKVLYEGKTAKIIELFKEGLEVVGSKYNAEYYLKPEITEIRTKLKDFKLELMK
jgi:starch synthase